MSKYDILHDYLYETGEEQVVMGFSEIENVLGFELPPSSRRQRAWWSNNPTNNVMTKAWLDAGYETAEVDMVSEKLVFRKARQAVTKPQNPAPKTTGPRRHPLFGALKGLMTIPPDLDLTQPADPDWGKVYDD